MGSIFMDELKLFASKDRLTIGGGPGTSSMLNPMAVQGPCIVVENGTVPNPQRRTACWRWILLWTKVNNSCTAAIDVYDFLQKFLRLFPNLVGNPFIHSGGSHGGIYVPHIATVIHELRLSQLEKDNLAPSNIQLAQQAPGWSVERRVAAQNTCKLLEEGDTHGTVAEDVHRCLPPIFAWTEAFFRRSDTKRAPGILEHVEFSCFSAEVGAGFRKYRDIIQPSYLLYGLLLKAGIRFLHYVGAQDANCAWPGVISFLKLLQSPFQDEFIRTPDVPWPTAREATVRVVGEGAAPAPAGNMTYCRSGPLCCSRPARAR
ncbi:Alpha/Beta hydrolase protein [Mycena leptocephala]|nr:Alpha/Beta hydrolase protein [Mycena leptocephala]